MKRHVTYDKVSRLTPAGNIVFRFANGAYAHAPGGPELANHTVRVERQDGTDGPHMVPDKQNPFPNGARFQVADDLVRRRSLPEFLATIGAYRGAGFYIEPMTTTVVVTVPLSRAHLRAILNMGCQYIGGMHHPH